MSTHQPLRELTKDISSTPTARVADAAAASSTLWVSASAFFNVYLQVGVGGVPSRPQQAQFAPVVSTSLAALTHVSNGVVS